MIPGSMQSTSAASRCSMWRVIRRTSGLSNTRLLAVRLRLSLRLLRALLRGSFRRQLRVSSSWRFHRASSSFAFSGCSPARLLRFGAVGAQVVQFPGIAFGGDQFPVADADRSIPFVQPPERVALDHDVLLERGDEASAGSRRDRLAVPLRGLLDADQLQDRGHDVDDVSRRLPQFAACLRSRRANGRSAAC